MALVVEESSHVTVDESNPLDQWKGVFSNDVHSKVPFVQLNLQSDNKGFTKEMEPQEVHKSSHQEYQDKPLQLDVSKNQPFQKQWRYNPDYPEDIIISDPSK